MVSLRDRVNEHLQRSDRSRYALAEECHRRRLSKTVVYEWLAGKRDILTTAFATIMEVLGLELCETGKQKLREPKPRGRKRKTRK